jgi:hypothetical protein
VTAAMEYEEPDPVPDWWPHQGEFPAWHVWRGVSGILYARRPRTSPPKVVRSKTVAGLRKQIRLAELPPMPEPSRDNGHELPARVALAVSPPLLVLDFPPGPVHP